MALDSYENRALHRARESGFPVCDWLRNMAAPPSGGQESNPCPLPHLPHHPGRRAEGLFPQLSWPALQGTPTGSHSSGFQWLLPNSAPGVKGMLSNLWNFFSAEKQVLSNSKFHSGLLSRHIVCRSLQSPSLPQQAWRALGDFSLFIFFSCWQGCKTPLQ